MRVMKKRSCFYEQAADLFYTDHSTAESNKCLLKVAQFSAEGGNYSKAMDIYESVAKASVDNNLLRFSAKGHLLMACLCAMCCMTPSGVAETVEKYKNIDFNLEGSRELKLVEACVEAIEVGDAEGFTTAVAEYDSLTRLDAFKTELLLRVKRKLIDSPTLDDEEDLT
jgi:alpha-soluble NSF attachment protein